MGNNFKNFFLYILLVLISIIIGFFIGKSYSTQSSTIDFIHKAFSIIFSFLGLILGLFYYLAKIKHDSKVAKINRVRQRLDILLDYLQIIEKNFYSILNGNFNSDSELEALNDLIDNNLFNIEIFIEKNDTLLELEQEDLNKFSELHSFYEGVSLVFGSDYINLQKLFKENPKVKSENKSLFNRYLNSFKKVCIHRGE